MTIEHLVYDIKMIKEKGFITDDSRLNEEFLIGRINNYRSAFIVSLYIQTGFINPVWLQPFGLFEFEEVYSADEPTVISSSSICYGKYVLPPVIALPRGLGIWNLTKGSKQELIYEVSMEKLLLMIETNADELNFHTFFFRIGNAIFTYPNPRKGNANLILENPFDGYIFDSSVQTTIVSGYGYTVFNGQVVYDGTTYNIGDTITGTATTSYTGPGDLYLTNNKRAFSQTDEYPIDRAMAQEVLLSILTKDFEIEKTQIADMINDSSDQFQILSSFASK